MTHFFLDALDVVPQSAHRRNVPAVLFVHFIRYWEDAFDDADEFVGYVGRKDTGPRGLPTHDIENTFAKLD